MSGLVSTRLRGTGARRWYRWKRPTRRACGVRVGREEDGKWQVYRHRSRQCESRLSGDKAGSTRATRPSRHVGLSPLKMVQPKPHCSDAAALERDTCTQAPTRRGAAWRNQNRKRIPCRAARPFIVDLGTRTITVCPRFDLSLLFIVAPRSCTRADSFLYLLCNATVASRIHGEIYSRKESPEPVREMQFFLCRPVLGELFHSI